MSLKTWKEEFYPVPATSPKTKIYAIKHSLRKWKGLTKGNLKKHAVEVDGPGISNIEFKSNSWDENFLLIDASSCALCQLYIHTNNGLDPNDDDAVDRCYKCPLYKALGKFCDDDFLGSAPFTVWENKHNPQPMIKALEKTLANETSSKT